jgi:hypothetical protein
LKIARVFPRKTNYSPTDEHAFFGPPDLFTPRYDKIRISVAFTWDIPRAVELANAWRSLGEIQIGGPGVDGESEEEFTPGLYLTPGKIVTSRGCPNRCSWCFIHQQLKELHIHEGNDIIDNNVLACSEEHLDALFAMLRSQRQIRFSGGLEAARITPRIVERFRGVRIADLFLAYDDSSRARFLERAADLLVPVFKRDRVFCYVLIGFAGDTIAAAEERLRYVWDLGLMPFAMLYRERSGAYPEPRAEWMAFRHLWIRPAIIKRRIKIGLDKRSYLTDILKGGQIVA